MATIIYCKCSIVLCQSVVFITHIRIITCFLFCFNLQHVCIRQTAVKGHKHRQLHQRGGRTIVGWILSNWRMRPLFQRSVNPSKSKFHFRFNKHWDHILIFFTAHNVSIVRGIKGLSSGVFFDNLWPSFLEVKSFLSPHFNLLSINMIHLYIRTDNTLLMEEIRLTTKIRAVQLTIKLLRTAPPPLLYWLVYSFHL